ncbi:MAG TPA: hypothetical protein VKM35_00490 [Arenimonas sp.]|uniref:hypothetical protein n=1 Tax=Arenimonas sp. TaxID=1872635 RepID=UPI002C960403|nr:hypothetical protein [Arenimonas sp.]HMB55668.1 hypothetical protein [Arenimonas sp.]
MIRSLFAIIAGLIAGILATTFTEIAATKVFAIPPGVDFHDPAQLRALIESMPMSAKGLIVFGWCLGAFLGAGVAVRLASQHRLFVAMAIGIAVAAGTIGNSWGTHPFWMIATGTLGPLGLAYLAYRTAPKPAE